MPSNMDAGTMARQLLEGKKSSVVNQVRISHLVHMPFLPITHQGNNSQDFGLWPH